MATLKLYRNKLQHNYRQLIKILGKDQRTLSVVTKLLCGHEQFLKEVLDLGINQVCDSRLSNLKPIKRLSPKTQLIYIKPPAKNNIKNIVEYCDISLNTQYETIKMLSKEAQRQKKVHKIIIMVEMGDLREGVLRKDLVNFYQRVFKLKGIRVIGIGSNFNCLYGVMPSEDKLVQLTLYKQIIELKFKKKLPYISAGSTVVIPLIQKKLVPKDVNHFRVGEALFFGADLFENKTLKGFFPSVFKLRTQIIEIEEKPMLPEGELAENPSGEKFKIDKSLIGKKTYRAIVDVGILDAKPDFLSPQDDEIEIVGGSSDMMVVDLKTNPKNYQVGQNIDFDMKYMGALSLMNSRYIDKEVI